LALSHRKQVTVTNLVFENILKIQNNSDYLTKGENSHIKIGEKNEDF